MFAAMGAAALLTLTAVAAPAVAASKLVVFAAASLKNAIDAVDASWKSDTGKETIASYGASNALARQVEAGAPADVFISADLAWMQYLSDKKLVAEDTNVKLLGNEIVLVAPKDSTAEARIAPGFVLDRVIGDGKLAMCDVKAVPAGKYGKAALEKLGVWARVESKVAQAENVRAALKLVATGEAVAGIVYATDAKAEPKVKVLGTFPAGSHPPIVYPAAALSGSKNPDAAAYVKYLQSAKAKAIFEAQGFVVLTPSTN